MTESFSPKGSAEDMVIVAVYKDNSLIEDLIYVINCFVNRSVVVYHINTD